MRDFKGMKRQRGRNRGSFGGSSGVGKPQYNANRAFDSNGPQGIKVRGAAQGVFEKYQQLARDAQTGGDRVLTENYLQHAEHYYRLLRAMQPQRLASEFVGSDGFSSVLEIDFEAEPEEVAAVDSQDSEGVERQEFRRDERPRDDRPRDERPREDRPRYNNDRPRDYNDRPLDDRPRDDRPREDRPRDERRRERLERQERFDRERGERAVDALPVIEPQPTPRDEPTRPRLRGQDGAISEAPAFLSHGAPEPRPEAAARDVEAPKKRGRPRKAPAAEER